MLCCVFYNELNKYNKVKICTSNWIGYQNKQMWDAFFHIGINNMTEKQQIQVHKFC